MRKVAGGLLILSLLVFCGASGAQETPLVGDAEYAGALLSGGKPVSFYSSGRVSGGTLKKEFRYGPYVLAANSAITFYQDGSVSTGTLSQAATDGRYSFAPGRVAFHPNGTVAQANVPAGLTVANLQIPVAANVSFDDSGNVSSFTTDIPQNITVLRRSVSTGNGVWLYFDETNKRYLVSKGTVADPQLVARVVTKYNAVGLPEAVTPIIVPYASGFQLLVPDGLYANGQRSSERWIMQGSFVLNGKNFGNGPTLIVRDMQLLAVQLAQAVLIDGVQYKPYDVINLDSRGQIVRGP